MPQVAARINDEQERWLKDYFRTKSAGAEFILPWAVDTFFRAMANIKQMFTAGELKTIVEAGAVDGCTARREMTVDNMDLESYLDILRQVRCLTIGEIKKIHWRLR